jgi:hypothetical protein
MCEQEPLTRAKKDHALPSPKTNTPHEVRGGALSLSILPLFLLFFHRSVSVGRLPPSQLRPSFHCLS